MTYPSRPPGITALCFFFLFGTVMSGLAAVMLLFPGSVLEPLWRLNPRARKGFAAMGLWAVLPMAVGLRGVRRGRTRPATLQALGLLDGARHSLALTLRAIRQMP